MSTRRSSSTSPERYVPDQAELRELGLRAGLGAIGFTHAEPFREARIALQTRRAHGRDGGMQFTYRNPERSTTPRRSMATAASLIVGAWPYASADPTETAHDEPRGEVAAYAWRDHYADLRGALNAVAQPLRDAGWRARIVADDNALVDRAAAIRAGVGWAGKNSNVLVPGSGSWFVLGAIFTDAPLAADGPIADGCGSCRRCLDGCPTGAIVADGVVDARRCLAWLLQAREFPVEFRKALGTRIYGCDECQTVCPPSRQAIPRLHGDEVRSIALFDLLASDDDTLLAQVHRWYIPGRELRYVRRNALIALGNATLSPHDRSVARHILDRYDPRGADEPDGCVAASHKVSPESAFDPMLRDHARWARNELGL